ncbi:hypothetical protein B0H19DRAFT_1273665 [Mycena capillaripes]|nr:hypothetical protein B0H19DRAFT_1273665 [Mycena capillaripes]
MPILGGLFSSSKSKNNPTASVSDLNSHSSSPHTSTPASPTADYVSSFSTNPNSGVPPSSPNGRGFAYAGEPQPARNGRGLGFFGRKRSGNTLNAPSETRLGAPDGDFDRAVNAFRTEQQPRPAYAYMSRLSTSSDLSPTSAHSVSFSGASGGLRPPGMGMMGGGAGASTRSLPPPNSSFSSSNLSSANLTPPHGSYYASSNPHTHSPLAGGAPLSPTKSTASNWTTKTSKSNGKGESKSAGVKAGRKLALFSGWGRKASTPPPSGGETPPNEVQRGQEAQEGFNLRSFRHVSPSAGSPHPPPPGGNGNNARNPTHNLNSASVGNLSKLTASNLSALEATADDDMHVPPRRPRPHRGSDASATSSRISVAAFREAREAVRRAPSPGPGMYSSGAGGGQGGGGGMYNLGAASASRVQQHQQQQQPQQAPPPAPPPQQKKKESGHHREQGEQGQGQWDDSEEESESEEEEESEASPSADAQHKKKARSEVGHGHGGRQGRGSGRPQRSEAGHGVSPTQTQPRSQSSLGMYNVGGVGSKSVGNVSTAGGAKRLSQPNLPALQIPGAPSFQRPQQQQQQQRPPASTAASPSAPQRPPASSSTPQRAPAPASDSDSDSSSSDEEEVDSDDAPLATLVAPRRPGSALSLSSRGGSQTNLSPAGSHSNLNAAGSHTNLHYPSNLHNSTSNLHQPHSTSHLANSTPNLHGHNKRDSMSGSSVASSSRPGKPKPLIDIAALTAAKPQTAVQREKERGMEGFTGGGMLAAAGAVFSAASSNVSSRSGAGSGNAPQSPRESESPVLTSRSPPVGAGAGGGLVHFPSPPGSPVKEVPPRVLTTSAPSIAPATGMGVAQRATPMRRETAGSLGAPSTHSASTSPGSSPVVGGGKRDVLSERLRAVAAANNLERERKVLLAGEREKAKTTTPPPMLAPRMLAPSSAAARKAFHRRSSSDIVTATGRGKVWGDDAGHKDKGADADDGALGRDLAEMLGGGLALVSRNGEVTGSPPHSPPRARSMDAARLLDAAPTDTEDEDEPEPKKDSIAPIVIKQRAPPPSFSVTSRPAHNQTRSVSAFSELGTSGSAGVRQRSSTLVPMSTASSFASYSNSNSNSNSHSSNANSTSQSGNSNAGSSTGGSVSGSNNNSNNGNSSSSSPMRSGTRQRSSTMMPLGTPSPVAVAAPVSAPKPAPIAVAAPAPVAATPSMLVRPSRPFAAPRMQHRNSPASSTGDSSSGPAPLTPRDGSDLGSGSNSNSNSVREEREKDKEVGWSGGVSGLVPVGAAGRRMQMQGHQRRSVSFDFEEDGIGGDGKGKAKAKAKPRETPVQEEERRRERRRSEARAAIELGNVINGRGPIADDDDDEGGDSEEDVPIGQQQQQMMMGGMNPMGMGMGMGMPMNSMGMMGGMNPMGMPMMGFAGSPAAGISPAGWAGAGPWQQQQPQMLSPAQFMLSPPAPAPNSDPNFYAAHQQAMMIAKHAYQMAVAQQAMAAAGEEWERGSSVGGFGGRGSVYGGGARSEYGGGGGGSVVGGRLG